MLNQILLNFFLDIICFKFLYFEFALRIFKTINIKDQETKSRPTCEGDQLTENMIPQNQQLESLRCKLDQPSMQPIKGVDCVKWGNVYKYVQKQIMNEIND